MTPAQAISKALGYPEGFSSGAADIILATLTLAGYVVVPREPTQEMLDAVCSDEPHAMITAKDGPVRETYQEMVDAFENR